MESESDQPLPWCSTAEICPLSPGSSVDITTPSLAAHIPYGCHHWQGYKQIGVKFMNASFMRENHWTVGNGESLNTTNILDWANIWADRGGGDIPRFVEAKPGDTAEIRVLFNGHGQCDSKVGMNAQSVEAGQPTMNLDLQTHCTNKHKRHLVIHEFGHALGLGHEHQRSTFWRDIREFIDEDIMKGYMRHRMRGLTDNAFHSFWEHNYRELVGSEGGPCTDYDPDSVMHYWFLKDWLRYPYSNKGAVISHHNNNILTDDQAKALLGVHKRHLQVANEPSTLDIELLRQVYAAEVEEEDERDSVQQCGGRLSSGLGGCLEVSSGLGGCPSEVSLGAMSSASSGLLSLAGAGDPSAEDYYKGEVENRHMNRIEWMEGGEEKEIEIYDEAACKWERIGQTLGLQEGTLTSIDRNSHDDRGRVIKVFGHWMSDASNLKNSKKYPKTWPALVKLLNKSHLGDLSKKLSRALSADVSTLRGNL